MAEDSGSQTPEADQYTPFGDAPPSDGVIALRLRAEQLVRDEDDAALLELLERLREDEQWWPHLWGPSLAIAASRSGRDGAIDLLADSVASGFSQPELFDGVLEERFEGHPRWPELVEQMSANVPAAPYSIIEWPDPVAALPLVLDCIRPDRLDELVDRLPTRSTSAWQTALGLLEWVRRSWEHANDHVGEPDALEVLHRVDAGSRFACVEYSIVLSQALNAAEIPGRRVNLRQRNHHVGVGRGHVVSEAWIDDLDAWVLLDGQNGAYWVDEEGAPLGVCELQDRWRAGRPARMVGLVDEHSERDSIGWFSYFASVSTTGYTWAEPGFSPVFQDVGVLKTERLVHDRQSVYPRLSIPATGLGGTRDEPVAILTSPHPYATGLRFADGDDLREFAGSAARYPLSSTPGSHDVAVTTLTPYGETTAASLRYHSSRWLTPAPPDLAI